jgi:choice-of-anchor C domain-containing protein
MGILLLAPMLLVVPPVLAIDDTEDIAGVWTASSASPGATFSVPHAGAGGVAEMDYSKNLGIAGGVPLTRWDFTTIADTTGSAVMSWTLSGNHAWCAAAVGLTLIIDPAEGSPSSQVLVPYAPNSCDANDPDRFPLGDFDVDGNVELAVQAGDTFGFEVSGSNGDLNSFVQGTLRVGFDVVKNGSFETPLVQSGGYDTIGDPDAPTLTDWDVASGDVDILNDSYWNPSDGDQSLDLDGIEPGTITQSIPTVIGQGYVVAFRYTANPESDDPDPTMHVLVDGVATGPEFTDTRAGVDVEDTFPRVITWKSGSVSFMATGTSTTIGFASTDPSGSAYGVALDEVTVRPDLGAEPPVVPTENAPFLYKADPGSSTTDVAGVLWTSTPSSSLQVQFVRGTSCDDDGVIDAATTIGGPFIKTVTTDADGFASFTAAVPFVPSGSGTTYIAAQLVAPPAGSGVGPCILITDDNTLWTNAT